MYSNGRVEEDDIPWQFAYPVNDDPFARHDARIPLQPLHQATSQTGH